MLNKQDVQYTCSTMRILKYSTKSHTWVRFFTTNEIVFPKMTEMFCPGLYNLIYPCKYMMYLHVVANVQGIYIFFKLKNEKLLSTLGHWYFIRNKKTRYFQRCSSEISEYNLCCILILVYWYYLKDDFIFLFSTPHLILVLIYFLVFFVTSRLIGG